MCWYLKTMLPVVGGGGILGESPGSPNLDPLLKRICTKHDIPHSRNSKGQFLIACYKKNCALMLLMHNTGWNSLFKNVLNRIFKSNKIITND